MDLTAIADAIRRLHGCEPKHAASVPVKETFRGAVVWDGTVEVFDITAHPKANRCYAWASKNDDGSDHYVAVLELPPIDSPVTAVRAAIVAESQKK